MGHFHPKTNLRFFTIISRLLDWTHLPHTATGLTVLSGQFQVQFKATLQSIPQIKA